MLPCTEQACNSFGGSVNVSSAFPSVYIHINLFLIHTFALLFFSFLTCSLMHSWSRDPMTAVFILKHTWRISHTQYYYSLWNTPGELATHSTATHSKGLKTTLTIIPGTWTINHTLLFHELQLSLICLSMTTGHFVSLYLWLELDYRLPQMPPSVKYEQNLQFKSQRMKLWCHC